MTKPLALISYEKLLPGSQLANRLHDLGYRVRVLDDPSQLPETARRERPLVIVADLASGATDLCAMIRELKSSDLTRHIPVLAFGRKQDEAFDEAAAAGAALVALDDAITGQLPHLLEQVLELQ
jgi:DNA-binding response OmpR family regulator